MYPLTSGSGVWDAVRFQELGFSEGRLCPPTDTNIEAACISESTRFKDDLAFKHFSLIKFSLYLEDVFDHELPNDVVERFTTVADVVNYFSYRYFRDVEPLVLRVAA